MTKIWFALLLALSIPLTGEADVYKCPQANGKIVFTERPCENGLHQNGSKWISVEEESRLQKERELAEIKRNMEEEKLRQEQELANLKKEFPKLLNVPSDPNAQIYVLEKSGEFPMRTIVTKRIGSSGISYSKRLYNCHDWTVKYLGTGDTLEALKSSSPDPTMGQISPLSIASHVGKEACNKW